MNWRRTLSVSILDAASPASAKIVDVLPAWQAVQHGDKLVRYPVPRTLPRNEERLGRLTLS
jgi:hypothetical protein